MTTWAPASDVKGLFTAAPNPTVPPPLPPPRPKTNLAATPAIALMVAGGILAIVALLQTVMALAIPQPQPQPTFFSDGDAVARMAMLKALLVVLGIVQLALSGVVVYGGIAMLNRTNYLWSMAAAVSAIVGGVLLMLPGLILVVPIGYGP